MKDYAIEQKQLTNKICWFGREKEYVIMKL